MSVIPTRTQAWELLNEYNQTEYLIKHALEVEGVMRYFANLLGEEDVDRWALVGLLHDLDYEKYPDEHCIKVQEILRERDRCARFGFGQHTRFQHLIRNAVV